MTNERALEILRTLADGVDIQTGQPLPADAQLNQPDAIRALFVAIKALEAPIKKEAAKEKARPSMAGGKWEEEEAAHLIEAFEAGSSIEDLAAAHQRTKGAIRSRLIKMGYADEVEARK